ncbi:glycoside hydrolase family 16 protein [Pedobacter psychroterrae]|uniref:Glycoside hydrolase family 16 protein n=1 Tax=Pedobacter psychroterrae TaxID=2530453 RepID=A0A4R0NR21_9SPHI|nr:glycoside hydrolase family 16 protein [Pedobacter psychroterrae]TCD03560.1 glycoside hydrolase family 16 protein [Pedobacter psychroterrae]
MTIINRISTIFASAFIILFLGMVAINRDDIPTILPAGVSPKVSRPGQDLKITYNWDAVPMDKNYSVWVHIKDASGATVFQNDHEPPFPTETSTWSGRFSYTQTVFVPDSLKTGTYIIIAGLYHKTDRHQLNAGPGVKAVPGLGYEIGKFSIDPTAPVPPLASDKKATLDLKGYKITFQDEFNGPLDVSALGPGTKWIAHTPYGGDFGDAQFSDPKDGFPFSIKNGILTITAKNEANKWKSGLLSSLDTADNGFSQLYGYFEMRAKLPAGPGTWPAFWLLKSPRAKMGFEVDIVEQYGQWPGILHTALHWWYPDRRHKGVGDNFRVEDMTTQFHTYGFLWTKNEMIWYFDGKELWRKPTPAEANEPMYVLIDLALGSGWPIDKTPNPSMMLVDYVRVYKQTARQ